MTISITARPAQAPRLTATSLTFIICAFIFATANGTFWGHALRIYDGRPLVLLAFAAAVFCLLFCFAMLFSSRWLVRGFLIVLLVIAASAAYFQETFGTIIDREMIQNAMNTTGAESKHLLTLPFFLHLLLYAGLPGLFVAAIPLRRERFFPKLLRNGLTIALGFGLCIGLLLTNYATYASVFREQKELMNAFQPGAPIVAAVRYAKLMMRATNVVVAPIGTDARIGPNLAALGKPMLKVIVVGETGRAQNWSLGGYARPTNTELAKRDITYFPNTTSCGTSTAVSVPCMFSDLTKDGYSYKAGMARENLLDVLQHAGIQTLWYDNNTGSQHVAKRISEQNFFAGTDPVMCHDNECDDRILVQKLQQLLPTITRDTTLVLHTVGSHGPSYYMRYPADFKPFSPTCDTGEIGKCTAEAIVNTYDNTIAFTDLTLSMMIDTLAADSRVASSLIYLSDHGESLGEDGLFLHGAPYFMAPETQTRVPMLLWMSPTYQTAMHIDQGCVSARAAQATSHDNLFHTVLGMMDVQTSVYQPALDLLDGCRTPASG